jgi:hypothetical protein
VTRELTIVAKFDTVLAGTSCSEQTKGNFGMSERLFIEKILVKYLDLNFLIKFLEFLNWNFHELVLPDGVLSAINTNGRSPLLVATDFNQNDGVLLVQKSATINLKVSILNVESHKTLSGDHKAHCLLLNNDLGLWLNEDLRLGLNNNLGLRLNEDLRLRLDVDLGLRLNNDFCADVVDIFGMEN